MSRLQKIWDACGVKRWHTHPHLSNTQDRIDGHSTRVALIALVLDPDLSRGAIINAISHDLGEVMVGDLPYTIKQAEPNATALLQRLEDDYKWALGFPTDGISGREHTIIKIADWFDAWLWMTRHTPSYINSPEWEEQLQNTIAAARKLEVHEPLIEITNRIKNKYKRGLPV